MEVKTCRRCRKFFNYISGPYICPVCKEEIEQEFQKVRKYVDDNPGVDINTVAEVCEVEPQQIRHWIKEERLQFASESIGGVECERCGKALKSGRLCADCKTKLTAGLNRAFGLNQLPDIPLDPPKKTGARMRFLDDK